MTEDLERRRDRVVVRRAGVVAAFTLLSRVLGYARDAILAALFGAGPVLDAFVVAHTIPNLLRRLVAEGALVVAFVPLLSEEKAAGGLPAMRRFAGAVVGLALPTLLVLMGLGMLFPAPLVAFLAPGFEGESAALAARLAQVMMPYILFVSLTALAGGALNVAGSFGPPAAAPILLNVAIIGCALSIGELVQPPILAVALGVTLGGVLQLALQVPFLLRHGLLAAPRWAPREPAVAKLTQQMLPAVFGVAVVQLNSVVVRQIGSFLPPGQLTCYYNATRLQEFALGVFAVSISVAALPALSEQVARRDFGALLATFRRALRATNFVTVPATLVVVALARPMVGVLFHHGAYSREAADLTGRLFVWLALALVPIGAIRVAVPAFYALGDTRTPVLGAFASLAATVGLGFVLGRYFLIDGLSIATSLGAAAQLLVLWRALGASLRRRAEPSALLERPGTERAEPVLSHLFRCGVAATPGAALSALLADLFPWETGGLLLGVAVLALLLLLNVAAYFELARLFRIPELGLILGSFGERFRRVFHRWL